MTKICRLFLVLIALVAMTGCATVMYDARSLDAGTSLNQPDGRAYKIVSSFETNDKAGWVIGIIPVNKPAGDNHDYLATLLAEEVRKAGGDAVINLKLRSQNQPLDIIAGILTWGVYSLRTTTITGDVIKYE